MTNDTPPAALLLPATLAVAAAIFSFGKRKPEPEPEPEPIVVAEESADEPEDGDEDTEGETLPVLATFSIGDELYEDRGACEQVWDALALPVRTEGGEEPTRFFALSAFDPAPAGRDAVALTACKLAQDATQRGYSVLLVDADVTHPTLHKLSRFAPRDGAADATPPGFADFLRGDTTRLEPLLKLAWRTEGLLLLPAGNLEEDDRTLTANATWERLQRLAAPLAEIVLLVAPPVFDTDPIVRNQDMLPRMDGVLIAYPSSFSAASDTEALEKMERMSVPQVGAIVAPPTTFDEESVAAAVASVAQPTAVSISEPEIAAAEPGAPEEPEREEMEVEVVPDDHQPITVTETEAEESLPTETIPEVIEKEPAPTAPVEPTVEVPAPVAATEAESAPPEPAEAPPAEAPRPSFLSAPTAALGERGRRDARRAVPIENVPIYNAAPVHPSRPAPVPATVAPLPANETMTVPFTPNTVTAALEIAAPGTYRPDVAIELLPATGTPGVLTLRADVGGTGSGPLLLLEVRTLAAEAKRLRADNPGSHASVTANTPLLILESLTAETAPEDATTLRLVVRESNADGAATLLEAVLETPDALRIKSGKPTTAGTPPVRFEVTTEPDDTARFRATIPPLDGTPALYVDLERTTTTEGRLSRVVLRLA